MIEITITVTKADVYDEVAKTTSYSGSKMTDDKTAYQRIFTTDEDRLMLERFWSESCNAATEQLKPFIVSVSSASDGHAVDLTHDYVVTLSLSSAFDINLSDSISSGLFSFFVSAIVSKWFKFTNKSEADGYGADALSMLADVMRKIYYRKKPTRVPPLINPNPQNH